MEKILLVLVAALVLLFIGCKSHKSDKCNEECITDSTHTAAPHGVITTTDDGQVVYTRGPGMGAHGRSRRGVSQGDGL